MTTVAQMVALSTLLALVLACPLVVAELRAGRLAPPQGTVQIGWLTLHGCSTANQECQARQVVCLAERSGPDVLSFYRLSLTAQWPKRLNWADHEYVLAFFRLSR